MSTELVTGGADPSKPPDGKSYVEAVVAAGKRSRGIVYFILIILLLTITCIRNTYNPDWFSVTIDLYQDLFGCLDSNDRSEHYCKDLEARAARYNEIFPIDAGHDVSLLDAFVEIIFEQDMPKSGVLAGQPALRGKIGDPSFKRDNYLKIAQAKSRLDEYIKRDLAEEIIPIPLVGSWINVNDLWMVGGAVMAFLLFLLKASLTQEYRNLHYIRSNLPAYMDLAIMSQDISALTLNVGRFYGVTRAFIMFLPSMVYSWLVYWDFRTYQIPYMVVSTRETNFEYALESLMLLVVLWLNLTCYRSQSRLHNLVREYGGGLISRTA
ncbi:MAG TPA: hypothetical protein VMF53_05565 [Alphaproteobacteria bacterium]|nr:hypothetical protein [Alphaproteobacteria bacterium]